MPDCTHVENQRQNISDALNLLDRLATGIDVNVQFRKMDDFEFTRECAIFDLLDIPLYHGWIVDPQPSGLSAFSTAFLWNFSGYLFLSTHRLLCFCRYLFFSMWTTDPSCLFVGRSWTRVLWEAGLNLDVLFYDNWILHAIVDDNVNGSWYFTGVYVSTKNALQKLQWSMLEELKPRNDEHGRALEILILFSSQKENGGFDQQTDITFKRFMRWFMDIGFAGTIFTWCNGQEERNHVFKRLDCVLVNAAWRTIFPEAKNIHFPNSFSDHKTSATTTHCPKEEK
ncbi:hypothetical protein IFM89_030130 [Coptis chinensis]|uniref:MINDY deubiquitinase domain-containing protein n=1 Tax=Coptis chinensis TaxID=261450 RepID=A0A835I4Y6_9MAGN|nr:hypothetical protein IFM89_030130 [Coptis chinensis]